jgi:hypothetical protein
MLSLEGHPIGWFLILQAAHGLGRILAPGLSPEHLIAIVHLALVTVTAWFFFMRFSFHYLLKLSLAAGYFFFF